MAASVDDDGEKIVGKKDLLTVLKEYERQQERKRSVSSVDEGIFVLIVKL